MLSTDHGDQLASRRMRAAGDYDNGARKAACHDGAWLTGVSHSGNRGLCTTAALPWTTGYEVVRDEHNVTTDWASGWTKLQCAAGSYAAGYAVRGNDYSSLLCVPSGRTTLGAGRTVWFDRGDNRPAGNPGGDYATGHFKGQCAPGEALAGVAYTARITSPAKDPDAIYCRQI